VEISRELASLLDWFQVQPAVVTLLSGGVDSGVLAVAAHRVLGVRALAVTGVSASLAASERRDVARLVEECGLHHREVATFEGADPAYQRNDAWRCYVCKSHLFEAAAPVAAELGAVLVSGAHVGDLGDWRPGMQAAQEAGVRAPYLELGFGKDTIRALARELGVAWLSEKPAQACLASRIPWGTPVTPQRLGQVERFEAAIHALGLRDVRVRHHGEIARIQVPRSSMPMLIEHADELAELGQRLGFTYTTLDLADLHAARRRRSVVGSEEAPWLGSRPSSGMKAS